MRSMKRPSRRVRLSATTILKNGRAFAPPRESRMTTMIYPWVEGEKFPQNLSSVATRCRARDYNVLDPMSTIRPSRDSDLPAITAIYSHHVLNGTGTFETTPPTESDMATRRADVLGKGLPYIVMEDGGQ